MAYNIEYATKEEVHLAALRDKEENKRLFKAYMIAGIAGIIVWYCITKDDPEKQWMALVSMYFFQTFVCGYHFTSKMRIFKRREGDIIFGTIRLTAQIIFQFMLVSMLIWYWIFIMPFHIIHCALKGYILPVKV